MASALYTDVKKKGQALAQEGGKKQVGSGGVGVWEGRFVGSVWAGAAGRPRRTATSPTRPASALQPRIHPRPHIRPPTPSTRLTLKTADPAPSPITPRPTLSTLVTATIKPYRPEHVPST